MFSRKLNKQQHPPLLMDNTSITNVNSHNHLGVCLCKDAKCKEHINVMVNKAWLRIGQLRSLKCVLSRFSLERMYTTFIRPLLKYADCSVDLQNDVEAVRIEAARIVTVATKLCNTQLLLSELK